jgi:PAS domain S-box-containing protein
VLQRLRPVRGMPVWLRYLLTVVIVLACFLVRSLIPGAQGYPFLFFLPAIVLASFLFDRGSGFLATFVSTGLAIYFFIEPRDTFVLRNIGEVVGVSAFLAVGLFTAAVIEALRTTVDDLVASEESLANNLNLLEAIVEGTPDPIFAKDREGRFVRVNSVLARIFGVPADVIRGKRDRDFLPDEVAARIESVDRQVMDTRIPLAVEELVTVAGEGARWFLSTKSPWYGADGKVIGLIGIARDIHERKQAEGRSGPRTPRRRSCSTTSTTGSRTTSSR